MALAFNPEVTQILWNRDLGRRERCGLIVSLCEFTWQGDMDVGDLIRLHSLFLWGTGVQVDRRLKISWDKDKRVAKLSFEKSDYFNGGSKYFAALTAAKNSGARRFLTLSAEGLDFWIIHFAHKVEESENKVEERTPTPAVPVPVPPAPPRVVRNVRRKEKPQYTEVPLEDDDE